MFIAYFNSFLTPFLLLLESTCHLRRLKNDFKKRASFVDDRQVRWQVFCMSPALPLTHLLSLLISYLQNLLYMHNTNAFLYFSQNMDFPQIGFEPEPTVSNIKKEGYSKSVGSNAGCYFCPFLWVEFLRTLLVVFALFSWHLTNYSWHDRNLWRHFSDCISVLFRLTTPQFPCL